MIGVLDVEILPCQVHLAPDLHSLSVNVGVRHQLVDLTQQIVADSNRVDVSGNLIRYLVGQVNSKFLRNKKRRNVNFCFQMLIVLTSLPW